MATTIQHEKVTRDELRAQLDAMTRKMLGLAVDQFEAQYRARELDLSSPAMSNLGVLARLLFAGEKKN